MENQFQLLPRRLLPNTILPRSLRKQIETDPLPAAILWVEMFLRPGWVRIAEYIYWKICNVIKPDRAKQMTVGLAQMKVYLWQEFMRVEFDKIPTIEDWENPVMNYYAVNWYLSQKEVSSLLDVSIVYTGNVNEFYSRLLHEALARLMEVDVII